MFQILVFCIWLTLLRLSEGYYTQQWVVHVEGGKEVAESLAKDHGFSNLGEVSGYKAINTFRRINNNKIIVKRRAKECCSRN